MNSSCTTQREPTWVQIAAVQAQASMSQQAYNFEEAHYFNNYEGHFYQPHNNKQCYYHSDWRTYDDFFYGNPSIQSQESSSSNDQEKIKQPFFEEQFSALLEETKEENDAREVWLPNMETKMDANMIANIDTNFTNLGREMLAIMDRMAIHVEETTKAIKEQYSRKLPSDIKNDDIWYCESVTLGLEEELSSPTLVEDKDNELAI